MPQSVILLADIPGVGQIGDLCKVKDGFARNYLLPTRKAMVATADAKKRFERQKEKLMAERDKQLAKSRGLADKVVKAGLVFERPVGLGGRLFGSVNAKDIMQELAKQGATIEKKSILMNGSIKAIGEHTIRVRIHSQVVVDVPVKVVGLEAKKESEHPEHEAETEKE